MASLVDIAKQYGLHMVAVRRTAGQDLVVPSVVHWRQNHYAAILDRQDDNYLVSDPTFGTEKWVSGEAINEEASGEFLVPAASLTNGWTQLARNETAKIHGMGLPNNINDGKDKFKPTICQGMPVWWVSEPYVNLWLSDQPLSYLTSRGQPFTFQLTYKQRDTRAPTIFSTAGWNNSWQSYVHMQSTVINSMTFAASDIAIYLPNGGEVDMAHGAGATRYDPETRLMVMQQGLALSGGYDGGDYGLRVVHPDGSQDIYGLVSVFSISGDYPYANCGLTRHIDPNGDTTEFQYDSYGGPYVLTFVVDPDGRTNVLSYNTSTSLLLAVTNAYGQSTHFKYSSSGNLTNIVDAQGLSSSITYDTNGYATLFHELIHSTGHPSRLNRPTLTESAGFGSNPYCKEELVAEMGAAFLSGHAGISEMILDTVHHRFSHRVALHLSIRLRNHYVARVTDTSLGTVRSLESEAQGLEDYVTRLQTDIRDHEKQIKELSAKVGAPFEHKKRYEELEKRQAELEKKLGLTKNQAPTQVEESPDDESEEKILPKQTQKEPIRRSQKKAVSV